MEGSFRGGRGWMQGWFLVQVYDSGDTASELVDLTAVLRHRPEGLEALT